MPSDEQGLRDGEPRALEKPAQCARREVMKVLSVPSVLRGEGVLVSTGDWHLPLDQ